MIVRSAYSSSSQAQAIVSQASARSARLFRVAAEDSRLVFVRRARNGVLLDQGQCRGILISVADARTDQVSIWRRRKKKGDEAVLVELKDYGALLELFRLSKRQYSPWERYSSRRG